MDNPQAAPGFDADGTGRTNLFKYVAGLNPLDPTSRFALRIEDVAGQPNQRKLIFSPIVAGRTFRDSDTPKATPVVVVSQSFAKKYFHGDALGARKFYRIEIAKP